MNEQDTLFKELKTIADNIQVDTQFADTLEAKLRQTPVSKQNNTMWIRRASIAVASILLAVSIIAILPPTRTIALEVISFFFPTDDEQMTVEPSNDGPETIEVNSIAEAEAIAGFTAYQWMSDTHEVHWIFAGEGIINIVYEKAGERGSFLHTSQMERGLRTVSPYNAVPPEVDITAVNVNGFSGEYVEGYWVSYGTDEDSYAEFEWTDEYFRQLHWINDEYDLHLMMPSDVANSPDAAVAIAESLVTQP